MAIDIRELESKPKTIRKVIMHKGSHINVYEPTYDQMMQIIEWQQDWLEVNDQENVAELYIDGVEIVKKLFPMLTDIKGLDDLSDEELNEIVENPSVALSNVKIEIETIMLEIFHTILTNTRKGIAEANYNIEANLANQETIDRALSIASKNSDGVGLEELEEMTRELFEEMQEEQGDALKIVEDIKEKAEELGQKTRKIDEDDKSDIVKDSVNIAKNAKEIANKIPKDEVQRNMEDYNNMLANYRKSLGGEEQDD